ncbi:MAG: thiE [Verrucomicrobia bacterium]|nr:thiE [Verrucomicrobiota bacterium]
MPLETQNLDPVMCLTQDGLALSHAEQASRLCAAGAKWIQLRMKQVSTDAWLETAREVVAICHGRGAICIVNDSVDIALAAGADGVHLGKLDLEWREARRRLGAQRLLGGTVNNAVDVARVQTMDCLDYVGVGPLRFTATKQKLPPILGLSGVQNLILQLNGLPAWVIGGVEAADLPAVRAAGAAGVAVSGALFRAGEIERNFAALSAAWNAGPRRDGREVVRGEAWHERDGSPRARSAATRTP